MRRDRDDEGGWPWISAPIGLDLGRVGGRPSPRSSSSRGGLGWRRARRAMARAACCSEGDTWRSEPGGAGVAWPLAPGPTWSITGIRSDRRASGHWGTTGRLKAAAHPQRFAHTEERKAGARFLGMCGPGTRRPGWTWGLRAPASDRRRKADGAVIRGQEAGARRGEHGWNTWSCPLRGPEGSPKHLGRGPCRKRTEIRANACRPAEPLADFRGPRAGRWGGAGHGFCTACRPGSSGGLHPEVGAGGAEGNGSPPGGQEQAPQPAYQQQDTRFRWAAPRPAPCPKSRIRGGLPRWRARMNEREIGAEHGARPAHDRGGSRISKRRR